MIAFDNFACPLCHHRANRFFSLRFRKKKFLPDDVAFMYCSSCNFIFTAPRNEKDYLQYYMTCKNDQLSDELHSEHYNIQLKNISKYVSLTRKISVLDFGCGSGGLLATLRRNYPINSYVGFDPNLEQIEGVSCLHDTAQLLGKKFDLIICSHVFEHAVDPYFLNFSSLLSQQGAIYVEVPDPRRYAHMPRKEYLYYLDRIHINHFSYKSMIKLFSHYNLYCSQFGDFSFTYKDGLQYPTFFMIFTRDKKSNFPIPQEKDLYTSLNEYISSEKKKKKINSDILIYGFGDNFFRSRQPGGPLAQAHILGVIDQNAKMLAEVYGEEFFFIELETAAHDYKDVPVVVCVSFGSEQIIKNLRNAGFSTVYSI